MEYPVSQLCRVLEVSRSGWYQRQKSAPKRQQRAAQEQKVVEELREVHKSSKQSYGNRRLQEGLRRKGYKLSRKKIARLQKRYGIYSKKKRPFRVTTKANAEDEKSKNVPNRDFTASAPHEKFVSDITYIHTQQGFCYLVVIIDLYSRMVVGYDIASTMTRELLISAYMNMIACCGKVRGALFHSDRGSQYTSKEFTALMERFGINSSMSRPANCWDNSVAESFFATFKWEEQE